MKQRRRQAEERAKVADAEREKAVESLKKLQTAYDEDALRAENESLKAQIRTERHKTKFSEQAKEAGLRPEAIEDAWNLSGYQPKTDVPDPSKIKATIEEQKTKRPYLFSESEPPPPTAEELAAAATKLPIPGPGKGQGGTKTSGDTGKLKATRKQINDIAWKRANREAISAGNFDIID